MNRAKEISRDTIILSISQYISQFANLVKGFLLAKYLGPYYLGVWGTVTLIQKYVPYSTLGTIFAMNREVPFFMAKGEDNRVRAMEETTRTFVLGVSILICIGIFVYSVLNASNISMDVLTGMRVIGITVVLQQLNDFYFGYLRARSSFKLLGITQVAGAILGLLVILALVSEYKINAAYVALIVTFVASLVIILFNQKRALRLRLHRGVMRALFALGISLLIYNLVALVYRTADRWLILNLLTVEDLGYYHFAIRIADATIMIPTAFSTVLYPRMLGMYGTRGRKEDLRKVVYVSSSFSSLVSPFILVPVYYFVRFVIRFYLPEYQPSVSSFAILFLGLYCSLAAVGIGNFLLAIDKQNTMTLVFAVGTGIRVAVGYGLVQAGYGLTGVAVGTVVGSFLLSIYYIVWVFTHFEATKWSAVRRLLRLYLPLPMMLAVFWSVSRLGPVLVHGASIVAEAGRTVVQIAIFYLLFGLAAYVLAARDKHLEPYLRRGLQLMRHR